MSDHCDSDRACWELGKRPCNSCEGYSRDVEGGLCRSCRGESNYDIANVRRATAIILGWKSDRSLLAEAEANDWLETHRAMRAAYLSHGGPAFLKGR